MTIEEKLKDLEERVSELELKVFEEEIADAVDESENYKAYRSRTEMPNSFSFELIP